MAVQESFLSKVSDAVRGGTVEKEVKRSAKWFQDKIASNGYPRRSLVGLGEYSEDSDGQNASKIDGFESLCPSQN